VTLSQFQQSTVVSPELPPHDTVSDMAQTFGGDEGTSPEQRLLDVSQWQFRTASWPVAAEQYCPH
jgi:hypothetical protein